jgi:CDP-diglyceride synthetase
MRGREHAVTAWQSDAQCVYSITRFRAMTRGYKLLSLAYILAPISVTAAIFAPKKQDWLEVWWPCLALFFWLVFALDTLTYLRGHLAQRRGIMPEGPGKRPSSLPTIGTLLSFMVIVGLMFVVATHGEHPDWALPLFFFALLANQCSSYARSRFWDAGQNGQLSPIPE